jgi:N-acetylglucosamine-6-phosphate deacetylase
MNSGVICGRHFATGEPVEIRWEHGLIHSVTSKKPDAAPDVWIAPALVDLQINGYGGIDFQQDNLSADELLTAARHLNAAGCTRFLLTLITDDWTRLISRLQHLRQLRDATPALRHAIAGWHVEGPFLSAEPGFCGAHDPALMVDPTPAHLRELRDATGNDPLLITLAPERTNALGAIEQAASLGMKVSLGHTNASAEILAEAVRRGATAFTHLGNAIPRDLDRHDNILWRVFETPGLVASLIPDTIHVSPALFRLVHRVLESDSIYYTTDAMSAAGMEPGRYPLGRLNLEVGPDQIVRQPGKPNFAGSALRPIEGVFRAAKMLGCSWQKVWPRLSETPAKLMELPSGLCVGAPADLCIMQMADANEMKKLRVIASGEERA